MHRASAAASVSAPRRSISYGCLVLDVVGVAGQLPHRAKAVRQACPRLVERGCGESLGAGYDGGYVDAGTHAQQRAAQKQRQRGGDGAVGAEVPCHLVHDRRPSVVPVRAIRLLAASTQNRELRR
ncbi:MAG TPA: hypothetical protein VN961_18945, partial [Streptosporangiaceae bacterium]|nr:hypothetical protein [Streptosporangiaceae bacterium]